MPVKAAAPSVTAPAVISAAVSVCVAVWLPSLSVIVPEPISLSMPDSVIETASALTPPVALAALSARAAPASGVRPWGRTV